MNYIITTGNDYKVHFVDILKYILFLYMSLYTLKKTRETEEFFFNI